MPKFKIVPESETVNQLQFMCPGCNKTHAINSTWTFNGDLNKPTVSPSILLRGYLGTTNGVDQYGICHSFIKEGKIEFLNDCTHPLAGYTVELPEIE